jgi:hypothetical protein
MAEFKPKVPVVQADPVVTVDVKPGNPLPVGPLTFQLIVVDDSGNESAPTMINVIVRDTDRPTAVLEMVDRVGNRVEPVVSVGQSFILSAAKSSDLPPGKVKEYRFMLLGA